MGKFTFLRAFFSPFIRPTLRFYCGKIKHGTPYFFPRRWVKDKEKKGYRKAVPKRIGFDFVSLGWKTKWEDTDYRYEWGPLWSFVFFKWQICVLFSVPEQSHYWESWLYYTRNTDKTKSTEERVKQCIEGFSQIWTSHSNGEKKQIDYYDYILKSK
jgi:hypothetical protein